MRLTLKQLKNLQTKFGYKITGPISEDSIEDAASVVERGAKRRTVGPRQAQKVYPERFHVVVTSFRTRLLDEDNLCEKYHIDCLRYAGILPSDAPAVAHIEVCQRKVARRSDERTEIEIWQIS